MVAWIEINHEPSNKDSYTVKLPLIQMHSHSAEDHTRPPFEPSLKRWTIPRQKGDRVEYRIPGREPISRWIERFFRCRPGFPSHRASAHSAKEKRIELLAHQQRTHHYCLRPQEQSSGPTIMFLSHQYFWKLMACWSGRLALRRHAWGSIVEMTGWG